ncbi:unnamed protein product [Gongylonema pulchrum]|uniref:Microtubule-associated protein n=1 Tax=Gongylonema pulchrum TaxID=637853 RepID=A0A183E7F1_9BILA|nr:unnamed protein product [Gongylonema pulchrum]
MVCQCNFRQQAAEERHYSGSPSPPPSDADTATAKQTQDLLSGLDNQVWPPPVPQYQESSDLLMMHASKHADEEVYGIKSEPVHQDLSQLAFRNENEPESTADNEDYDDEAIPHHGRFDEKAQSFDLSGAAGNLIPDEPGESLDTTAPLVHFPPGFDVKHRSVSLSAEDNLRKQLKFIGPCAPIPVKFEDPPAVLSEEPNKPAFGVAGPGEILVETMLVQDTAIAAPLLYPIPSENEFEIDTYNSAEPEFVRSGSEEMQSVSDFVCKTSSLHDSLEKENADVSEELAQKVPDGTETEPGASYGTAVVPDVPYNSDTGLVSHKLQSTDFVPAVSGHTELVSDVLSVDGNVHKTAAATKESLLSTVPAVPISENIPAAVESPALEDVLKFSAAPVVQGNASQPAVQPTTIEAEEELVQKTELTPLKQRSEPEHHQV